MRLTKRLIRYLNNKTKATSAIDNLYLLGDDPRKHGHIAANELKKYPQRHY